MAVLTIDWENSSRIAADTAVVTPRDGEDTEEVPASDAAPARLDKPLFVYVTRDEPVDGFDKIEEVVLTDDKIAVGTNAFRCVKMTLEDAMADSFLQEHVDEAPMFILVAPDWEYVKALDERRISVSGTYSAMKRVARKSFENNFDRNVRELVKLLNEFDKINNERALLKDKEERMDNPSPADERKLAREREELDEREREANELKTELLTFELSEA